jgi:hypothetical protein
VTTQPPPDLIAARRNRGLSLDDACAAIKKQSKVTISKSVLHRAERREALPRDPKVQLAIAAFYGFTVTAAFPIDEPAEAAA